MNELASSFGQRKGTEMLQSKHSVAMVKAHTHTTHQPFSTSFMTISPVTCTAHAIPLAHVAKLMMQYIINNHRFIINRCMGLL